MAERYLETEWSSRLAAHVGRCIRRARDLQNLSAQKVADRSVELGHPVPRATIADLEHGRRRSVAVPDVLVLAIALGVPPIDLLFPIGYAELVEVAPGVQVRAADANGWVDGSAVLGFVESLPWSDGSVDLSTRAVYQEHWDLVTELGHDREAPAGPANQPLPTSRHLVASLGRVRSEMVRRGMETPALRPELLAMGIK